MQVHEHVCVCARACKPPRVCMCVCMCGCACVFVVCKGTRQVPWQPPLHSRYCYCVSQPALGVLRSTDVSRSTGACLPAAPAQASTTRPSWTVRRTSRAPCSTSTATMVSVGARRLGGQGIASWLAIPCPPMPLPAQAPRSPQVLVHSRVRRVARVPHASMAAAPSLATFTPPIMHAALHLAAPCPPPIGMQCRTSARGRTPSTC